MHTSLGPSPQHPPPAEEHATVPARNKTGLVALILGIVSMVMAVIPFVNFVVGLVGLAGIIVGIVALTRKGKPKGQGLTGLILSVVASILAAVLAFVYSVMFLGAALGGLEDAEWDVEWEIEWETEESEWDAEEEIPWTDLDPGPVDNGDMSDGPGLAEGEATATSPAPLGTPMRTIGMRDWEYQVVLGPSMLDANALVAQLDTGNPPPKEGTQYIAIQATVTYLGSDDAIPHFNVEYQYPNGERTALKDVYRKISGANTQFKGLELKTGESYTEIFVRQAHEGDLSGGMWVVIQPFWNTDYYFMAQ